MKKTQIHIESKVDSNFYLSYNGSYHRDKYRLVELGEFTGMIHEDKQEMEVPEAIFEELLLRLLKHNKALQVRALDVIKEEIQNPTRLCDRCNERITVNIQTAWCHYCIENHG